MATYHLSLKHGTKGMTSASSILIGIIVVLVMPYIRKAMRQEDYL